jgi:hypothetical protein
LRQWQETLTRETLAKKEQSKVPFLEDANNSEHNENTQYERPATSTFLRFYLTEPAYLNPNTPQVTSGNATERSTDHGKRPTNDAREEREDEQEFSRIPIAGEDSEDYQGDCWDTESDDNKAHAGDDHNKFTTNVTRIITQPNSTCEQSSLDDSDDDVWWSDLAKFNDEDNSENSEDHGLPSLTNNPLPIVEPLPYSYAHALTGVPMTASMTPFNSAAMKADDIAFLIGHVDGIVQTHQLTPIPTHANQFNALHEINDKVNFTQNMHGMVKGEHKRKLTKEEKQLDQSAQDFNLLLFSSIPSDPVHDETRKVPLQVITPTAEKK